MSSYQVLHPDRTTETPTTSSTSTSHATSLQEKALIRKIDLRLLPTIWLMYCFSYIDRTNIGNAKVAGMQQDLHFSSGQFSLALIVFFITYVLFEVPSNLLLSATRPSIYLPTIMVLWGMLTSCMAAVKTYKQLIAIRTILGCLEAGFAPAVILLFSSWYKEEEQSKRFAVYISAAVFSGAFGGLLAGGIIDSLDGSYGIRGWRWLFIIEGVTSITWALISFFLLLDFPATSSALSDEEKLLAELRLKSHRGNDRTSGQVALRPSSALKLALADFRTWLFMLGYMTIVGSLTIAYFYPTLVSGLGYKGTKAQYMTIPIYAAAFVSNAFTGYFCDRISHQRGAVIMAWLTLSMACSIVVCIVYSYKVRYVMLVLMAAGLWSSNALSLSYASSTFRRDSREVRAVALACVNAMGNLAQIYGAYLFPDVDSPKYLMGFEVISAMSALGVVVYGTLHLWLKKRAAID